MEQVAAENNWISDLMRSQCRTYLRAVPPEGYGSCSIYVLILLHVDSSAPGWALSAESQLLSWEVVARPRWQLRENLQGTYGMAVRFFCHGQEEKGVISWNQVLWTLSYEAKFCALQDKKTWEILGSYKKGRWTSTWDGHFPRYRICRDLIIGVENVVTIHGISWHGLPGVGNCLWM